MKNILIPTDFSIKSLKLVAAAVQRFHDQKLNVTLLHALEPDHSISGLLMLNKRLQTNHLYTEEFWEACEVLRNKYASSLQKLKVEFYYGTTTAYRNNFLQARNIDAIVLPKENFFQLPSKHSRDITKELMAADYPLYHEQVNIDIKETVTETASLTELLPA